MKEYIWIALLVSFLWGIAPVIHKHLMNRSSFVTIMVLSNFVYVFCICIFAYYNRAIIIKEFPKLNMYDFILITFTAMFTAFFANLLYFYVLKDHESSLISALIYSSPIFTLLIAYFFLRESIDIYGLSGIIFIVIGVIFISMNDSNSKELFAEFK